MSFAIGSTVEWVTFERATGRPHNSTVTRISAFEDIRTSAGPVVRCAVLECNRLAPLSELYEVGSAPEIKRESKSRTVSTASPGRVDSSNRRSGDRAENSGANEQPDALWHGNDTAVGSGASSPAVRTENSERTVPVERPAASASPVESPCSVLAIDFMNLLVRAWHAGKPTETHAVRSMFQTVANAIRKLNPAHVVFALDGGHTRRTELLPAYKAHRQPHDPNLKIQIELAQRALQVAGFYCIRKDGWEADDVLATLAESFSDTVIVSSDKDLLVMTGRAMRCRVYHPWGDGEFVTAQAKIGLDPDQITDYLALCGDTPDGVPGVSGIGPKTALDLLKQYGSLDGILAAATTGQIKGAKGEKLKTQREQALLCREVIQLNWDLFLVPLESFAPKALWRQKLQDMRLQSVAAIMESLQGLRFAKPQETPLSKQHYEAAAGWFDADECLQWAKDHAATVAEMRAWRRAKTTPMEGLPASATTAEVEPGGRVDFQDAGRGVMNATRTDQPSQDDGQSVPAHTNGLRPANATADTCDPMVGPAADSKPVSGSDAWLKTQYEQGQKYARYAISGRQVENPWRRDSPEFYAWDQGFRGVPFSVDAAVKGALF